jgi:PAS domain S-box-containing protein
MTTKARDDDGAPLPVDFGRVFEAAPSPFLLLAPDAPRYTIVAVNDAYLHATLTTRQQLLGLGLFEAFPDPPDEPNATGTRNLRASIVRAAATGQPDRMAVQHYDIRRPDGSWEERHWSPLNTPILDADGTVRAILHHVEDVTTRVLMEQQLERLGLEAVAREAREALLHERERLVSEQDLQQRRLLTVLEQSPVGIVIAEAPSGRVLFANEQAAAMIGVLRPDTIEEYGSVYAGLHPDGRPVSSEEWPLAAAILRGERTTDTLLQLRRIDGRLADVTSNAAPVRDAEGRIIAAVAVFRDVTEERRAASAIEQARREAEVANGAKSDFLAMMSHELRTPLNAIGGYVELIELGIRGPVTDDQLHDLRRIQIAQRHLIGLINDVLNYVRIEGGRLEYALSDIVVDDLLASLEALVGPQLRAKGLAYTYVPCDPRLVASGDRDKVNQILLNLLTNAVKFTPPGGRLRVTCDAEDEAVIVRVADTGRGIASDHLTTIFEPFVQVDNRLTRTADGVGLGLAISRDLARGMGGELSVASEPGIGSMFTLTLPRVRSTGEYAIARRGSAAV